MPVSPPLQRKSKPTEADIEKVILKGGAVADHATTDPDTIRHVSARLTDGIIRQIDALRSRRPRRIGSPKMGVSLRDWIVEAVIEKLERDNKKARP